MASPLVLVLVFVLSAVVGYFIIRQIPSLLHTPLMSGMNALSGITIVGAIIVVCATVADIERSGGDARLYIALILGGLALILAMINVVGGFGVTERMLKMFHHSKSSKGRQKTTK